MAFASTTCEGAMTQTIQHTLRTDDAARYIGLSASTMAKLRLSGKGPQYIKTGRIVLYRPADLDSWLDAQLRSSTSE
ncbi:helix-turn-helix transcriptional regulator [Pacificispira sp.]|uniref:helix-turn-helix transcriptional regulator n=1 Tax=Pacificispira sp. TaxID=2888761 RepID=UPI003B52DF67